MDNVFRFPFRRQLTLPGLIDWTSTITTAVAGGASMDYPLVSQRLPQDGLLFLLFEHLFFQP